jgi:hypothetical protein
MENIIKIGLALLLLGCLADMPYGYFQLVRFCGMAGFAYLAVAYWEEENSWGIIFLLSAILINPFFKISLGRELWNVIDVIWAILLLVSIRSAKEESS